MYQLISKSSSLAGLSNRPLLHSKWIRCSFSSIPPNIVIQKSVEYQFKFRSLANLHELYGYILSESEDIKKYGKTVLLQFLNEYPMQSYRRFNVQFQIEKKQEKQKLRNNIYFFLKELNDLNFYEQNMRYAIFKKLINYIGPNPEVIKEAEIYQVQLIKQLQQKEVHILDVFNWLYMLPLNYPPKFSSVGFQLMDEQFENPSVREFIKNQRALPALIKRIYEKDWAELRKYKNILKFLCYEATLKQQDNFEELVISFERICSLKLHLVGEKVMPKILDQLVEKMKNQFDQLSRNKQLMLKIFSCFTYLPLNYNLNFFNQIHNHLKTVDQLPSHLLLYLPYNKLNSNEITYLQTKMFTQGRTDIAPKLIYTIYKSNFKNIFTPFIIKQAYRNLLQIWNKDDLKSYTYFQVYVALIFRFSKMGHPIIEQKKLKEIFSRLVFKIEQNNFQIFTVLSAPGLIAFIELCHTYEPTTDDSMMLSKVQSKIMMRKSRNTAAMHIAQLMQAINVHYNTTSQKSRYLLTTFIYQITKNPETDTKTKLELLFLIEKTLRPEPKWLHFSAQLFKETVTDIDAFVEIYILYENKTLKLTNFVFTKLYEKKAGLYTVIELLGSLNLKLLTSLKGKLISPLKKYICQLDFSQFDLTKSSMNCLVQAFRVLFYFRNQIPQFMEYLSISLIHMIEDKCKNDQYVNGKQFASLSCYIMEVLVDIDIKRKTQIIEYIVSIIKTLRKKQGIYLKVYELDFLCTNQKYIKMNNEVLEHHWAQIVQTLKNTQRIDHHKELFLLAIKLHCREFVELNSFDLRYFIDKCTQMIENSVLNLTQIKQCLGYEILRCEDEFVIEKIKIFMSSIIKLAFRKEKRKQNYFIYEFYLNFFSKLQSTEMITQICQKLLYQKLYPVEVSKIVPILSKNQIKNKKFVKRILDIMLLSDAYVTFEKMQIMSWLEKILYQVPQNYLNLTNLRSKINQQITLRIKNIRAQQNIALTEEERPLEDGYVVNDSDFDKNYKVFIEYAWSCLKLKNTNTTQFQFISRYLFSSIDKLKAHIQNPLERKQLSKIKLHHLFKFMKESGYFEVDEQKPQFSVRQINHYKQKLRKMRLLSKMQSHLNSTKIEACQKLEKKLTEVQGLNFTHKVQVNSMNPKLLHLAEYFIEQQQTIKNVQKKVNFIIHTVKKYHYTPELDVLQSQNSYQQIKYKVSEKLNLNENDIIYAEDNQEYVLQGEATSSASVTKDDEKSTRKGSDFLSEGEAQQQLQFKPEKEYFEKKQIIQKKQIKPLFSKSAKNKKKLVREEKVKNLQKTFNTALKLESPNENLYKDYNGYLRVQKSIIQIVTGLKCILYDPERDIFFG